MTKSKDISGQRFGIVTVLFRNGTSKNKKALWNCICDCGTEWNAISGNLISGKTLSCGCHRPGKITHGMSKSNEYKIWCDMIARCYNNNNYAYKYYGERGICVSEDWKNNFSNFIRDMGNRPSNKHSLERINVNGNYCKENVIWATSKEQSNNKKNSRKFYFNGKNLTARQIMDELKTDLPVHLVIHRIDRGWDIEKAATKPVSRNRFS